MFISMKYKPNSMHYLSSTWCFRSWDFSWESLEPHSGHHTGPELGGAPLTLTPPGQLAPYKCEELWDKTFQVASNDVCTNDTENVWKTLPVNVVLVCLLKWDFLKSLFDYTFYVVNHAC